MTTPTIDALWKGYQIGQGSADHTAKEVFAEVIGPVLRDLVAAQEELKEAQEKLAAARAGIAQLKADLAAREAELAAMKQRAEAAEKELARYKAADGEEIVRELRSCVPSWVAEKAASRITLDAQEKAALKGELTSVKAHAEAMAAATDILRASFCTLGVSDLFKAQAAYRAARPKE